MPAATSLPSDPISRVMAMRGMFMALLEFLPVVFVRGGRRGGRGGGEQRLAARADRGGALLRAAERARGGRGAAEGCGMLGAGFVVHLELRDRVCEARGLA